MTVSEVFTVSVAANLVSPSFPTLNAFTTTVELVPESISMPPPVPGVT